jgi:putative flavoprotein involved in K+ transport
MKRIETVVIGAGQCGLAMSACLLDADREHVVLERGQVAQAWRERWDSLTLLTPNWFTRLPRYEYRGGDPDGFMGRDDIVTFFADYASLLEAPVECGFEVAEVNQAERSNRLIVRGANGTTFDADNVVVAIGGYHAGNIPAAAERLPRALFQIHSSRYRNPEQLPPGAVLVVGAGASGQQIAEELLRSGRIVYISVGTHNKLPRRYRGRDTIWWMEQLGTFNVTVDSLPSLEAAMRRPSVALTGVAGGHDLDLRDLEREGLILLGHVTGVEGSRLTFAPDVESVLADGDKVHTSFVESVDLYVEKHGLRCDPPDARPGGKDRGRSNDLTTLDTSRAGVTSIVWATGFRRNFDWIRSPEIAPGRDPVHVRGVSTQPGLFFLGLRWLYTRRSNFIDGAGADAAYIRSRILQRAGRAWQRRLVVPFRRWS